MIATIDEDRARMALENIMCLLPPVERELVAGLLNALACADDCVDAMRVMSAGRPRRSSMVTACQLTMKACKETLEEGLLESLPGYGVVLLAAHEMRKEGTLP